MAPLFTTHPIGIRGHCDEGHQTRGLLMNRHPTRVLHPPTPHFPVTAGQDQQPRAYKASVLEAETLGVGHGPEGQGGPPAGAEL